ncbi:NADH-cytochrome b5 reductase 2 [Scheffersomyces xylosifermentans]|uniref:NADH-cytochrome b5 reductase 2 n=1 Tax=Scheffersomyces xylosifermentans TaxID=1304137 RepID=UPI00315CF966
MSFARQFARLASPKFLFPVAGAAASVGLAVSYSASVGHIANDSGKAFKGGDEWIDLKLLHSHNLSDDTKHLIFELPNKDDVSGLITASLLMAKFVTPKGSNVIRPYTPVSDPEQKGTIDFVVKKYEGGKMSSHIHDLKPNDTLSFKGPFVKWKWEPNQFKSIFLIGGGTGITPLYQLIREITKNPEDKTKVSLFYGSVSPDDILIKEQLDALAAKHKDQVKIVYFVDKADASWKGEVGYIDKEFLQKNLSSPSKDDKIFVCGPPGLYKAISGPKTSPTDQGPLTGILGELGYAEDEVFKF